MLKKLKKYYKRQWKLSEKIAQKISVLSYNYNDKVAVFRIGRVCYISLLMCVGIVMESWENFYKEIRLRNILKCEQERLVIGTEELLEKKSNTEFLGDNFEYSVATPGEYLNNIKLIFGNADLRALKDVSCLKNLVYVMGDLYLASLQGIEKLEYVGGKIFFQDLEFGSLTELFAYKREFAL